MEHFLNNNVLIIDDKFEEAKPVMQALERNGISTLYWNGDVDTKPYNPHTGIRLVFLDMRFSSVTNGRDIVTFMFTLLKDAIHLDNGPYVLFIWSKHTDEYFRLFKEEIEKLPDSYLLKPYLISSIEKKEFIDVLYDKNEVFDEIASALESTTVWGEVSEILGRNNINEKEEIIRVKENGIMNLYNRIMAELKKVNALAVLLLWEKEAVTAVMKFVNEIAGLSSRENWDNNIKVLIQRLAEANAGSSLKEEVKEYIKNAFGSLNTMLQDQLGNIKYENDELEYDIVPASLKKIINGIKYSISIDSKRRFVIKRDDEEYCRFKSIDRVNAEQMDITKEMLKHYNMVSGNCNYKLLCNDGGAINKPGRLFEVVDEGLLSELSTSILKNANEASEKKLVWLDISSSCDYAQNKLARIRGVYGIMIIEDEFNQVSKKDSIFLSPIICINKKVVKFVFNFQFICSFGLGQVEEFDVVCAYRENLITEIRHKLSSYLSRVGIINL